MHVAHVVDNFQSKQQIADLRSNKQRLEPENRLKGVDLGCNHHDGKRAKEL